MPQMLVRNRVEDYDRWRSVFDERLAAPDDPGLALVRLWRDLDDPQVVWFLFDVEDLDRARAYVADPREAEVGERAGVLEGEIHWVEDATGTR